MQYLELVRKAEDYNEVAFPHCPCDSRKQGHVIAIVGPHGFKLQACQEDGTLEVSSMLMVGAATDVADPDLLTTWIVYIKHIFGLLTATSAAVLVEQH